MPSGMAAFLESGGTDIHQLQDEQHTTTEEAYQAEKDREAERKRQARKQSSADADQMSASNAASTSRDVQQTSASNAASSAADLSTTSIPASDTTDETIAFSAAKVDAARQNTEAKMSAAESAAAEAEHTRDLADVAERAARAREGPPPQVSLPQQAGEPTQNYGWVSRSCTSLRDQRYPDGESHAFNLVASVLLPRMKGGKVVGTILSPIRRVFTDHSATQELRQQEANHDLDKLIWAKLKPFMADHTPAKRQRKQPITSQTDAGASTRGVRDRSSRYEPITDPSNVARSERLTGHAAFDGAGRQPACPLSHHRIRHNWGTSFTPELFIRSYSAVQRSMLEALRQRLLDTQRQLAKVNAALASASEENEQLRADLRKLQQWAMAQSDADDSELPLPHHMQ